MLVNVCVCFICIKQCMFVSKCIAVSPIPFISLSKMSVSLYDLHLATAAKHTYIVTNINTIDKFLFDFRFIVHLSVKKFTFFSRFDKIKQQ